MKEGTEEKPEYETVYEMTTLNSMTPIWQKNKKDVTEEEYNTFYREKFFQFEEPLATIQTSVEGVVTFKALLFIPSKTPYDYYTKEYKKGLKLYSSGVLIMDNCEDILPDHFRFVKGVVDSQDFSLNISREILQHDRQLKTISKTLEKKIKNELSNLLKNDREKYEEFFKSFGREVKYGIVSEYGTHKELLQDLLLFYSSTEKKMVTLSEYVDRMKEEQKYIYFATGDSVESIDKLPQTEILQNKGFEILYCTEDIDEFTIQGLATYKEKTFRSVANDDLGLDDDTAKAEENKEEKTEILTFVKEALGDKVNEVVESKKLVSHPVCLTAKGGISFEMEKYFAQVQPEANMKAQRVLELNLEHDAVKALSANIGTDDEKAKLYAELLYNQALLIAGLQIEDPSAYANLVCKLMK